MLKLIAFQILKFSIFFEAPIVNGFETKWCKFMPDGMFLT